MLPRIIATDLDGTLLNSRGEVSSRTIAALRAAHEAGVIVVFAGADKGAGLRWLCANLAIDAADVLVFGDEVNDLAMFEFAGRSVAVANASPLVRAAATEVTESNDDDGVAIVIESVLAHH